MLNSCCKEAMSLNSEIHEKFKGKWVPYKMISSEITTLDAFCASNLFGVYMNAIEIYDIGKYNPSTYCPPDFNDSGFEGIYEIDENTMSIKFTEVFDNSDSIHLSYQYKFLSDNEIMFSAINSKLFVKKLE
jgi:hypothetical protein